MPFKFIHTADLHFDSPLRSLALKDPELADIIAVASRRAFGKIVELCLELKADALLISGDTYDGEVASAKKRRLPRREIPAIERIRHPGLHDPRQPRRRVQNFKARSASRQRACIQGQESYGRDRRPRGCGPRRQLQLEACARLAASQVPEAEAGPLQYRHAAYQLGGIGQP